METEKRQENSPLERREKLPTDNCKEMQPSKNGQIDYIKHFKN